MKLTLAQALATVLNIHLVPPTIVGASNEYVIRDHSGNGEDIPLGTNLRTAIIRAIETYPLDEEIAFAIFPIGSEREGFYMEIERELLRQEAMPDLEGHKAWETFGTDPRKAIEMMMETARLAACNLTVPPVYRQQLLRFACVAVAALQWCDKWIEKLTALAKDPELGNRILRPAGFEVEEIPALNEEPPKAKVDRDRMARNAQEENE